MTTVLVTRPAGADDLLPERALDGDPDARAALISDVYEPLVGENGREDATRQGAQGIQRNAALEQDALDPVRRFVGTVGEEELYPVESSPRRLQTRLDESRDAASRVDGSAVSAALAAYQATVDEALTTAGENHDVLARLEIELTRHQVVLETLQATLPANAADAIRQVLDRESHALDVIRQLGPAANPGNGSGGGNGGAGNGDGGNGGNGAGGAGGAGGGGQPTNHQGGKPTDKPGAASQHPDKSPKATGGH